MIPIVHRVNTIAHLTTVPSDHGVEVDLRDHGDRVVLQHDPFCGAAGEDFEEYLRQYCHRIIILNVKSERIEHRVLEMIRRHGIEDYFFLDCSFPMIRTLVSQGERRIAVRFSEYEPLESALALAGCIDWVWVDCFSKMPLTAAAYAAMRPHFKLCTVSPELQGHDADTIRDFREKLAMYDIDAVCTKRPDLWRHERDDTGHR